LPKIFSATLSTIPAATISYNSATMN
jgi:hypothetical protein